MPFSLGEKKELRVLLLVVGGFVIGILFLLFIIATDL